MPQDATQPRLAVIAEKIEGPSTATAPAPTVTSDFGCGHRHGLKAGRAPVGGDSKTTCCVPFLKREETEPVAWSCAAGIGMPRDCRVSARATNASTDQRFSGPLGIAKASRQHLTERTIQIGGAFHRCSSASLTAHLRSRSTQVKCGSKRVRRACRARWSRVFTDPGVACRISAVSRVSSSSISRRIKTIR